MNKNNTDKIMFFALRNQEVIDAVEIGKKQAAKEIFEEIEKLIKEYLVGDEFDPADTYNFAIDFTKLKEKYLGDKNK